MAEHPIIRSLDVYGELVRTAFHQPPAASPAAPSNPHTKNTTVLVYAYDHPALAANRDLLFLAAPSRCCRSEPANRTQQMPYLF
jgi:hypothetical protein